MTLKSYQSDSSDDESIYEYPSDSCNHLISTSLRDLSSQYKNLKVTKLDSPDPNKNNSGQGIQSDSK